MLLELWLAALRAEVGIAIPTDNRALLRQHLYKARAEAKNPELEQIVMIMPEQEDEIWLVHKDADSGSTPDKGYTKLVFQ
jgi:DNA-binding phage protein